MDVDLKVIRHTTLLETGSGLPLLLDAASLPLLLASACPFVAELVGSSWPVTTNAAALPSQ